MNQPDYRVLLEGRMVGPYGRETILGMRIKQMLSGDEIVVSSDGTRLTVRELARQEQPGRPVAPSNVQAAHPAAAGQIESNGSTNPVPQQAPVTRVRGDTPPASSAQVLVIAVTGIVLVIGVMLVVLLRRVY